MGHHHTVRWTDTDRLDLLGEDGLHGCVCETPVGWEWTCQACGDQGEGADQAAAWSGFLAHERAKH